MDDIKTGWFSELSTLWPGQCLSLEVEEVLFHEKSKFQDIMVIQSKAFGRTLILDGVIQCTEKDEFSYQEMITFLPLNSHPQPRKVLIVGGGDGGVAREAVRHPAVEQVVMCEIDQMVVDVSKRLLPFMAAGFQSPKLELHFGDGLEFMKQHRDEFDVIITDSSDPVGPACTLFEENYFELMSSALRAGGIICSQGENMWFHQDIIRKVMDGCRKYYGSVSYGFTTIPTYPGGQIGFVLAAKDQGVDFSRPRRELTEPELDAMGLRYYSSEVHRAAFVLPRFVRQALAAPQ
ncbi:spermidine synthase-like isoform X2 [Amphibalanus amphitrite]|uniref:spermidine synthase-like isoform X1 n=1 Tax=Amphibalanus amphitrite TaxID=1232801 RepID=UPI001C904A83|nr:spermidine synthase-like isoform X1 [Amphibalanus amphitrite]XP_043210240.1 spermidine synthase-like isoform X2 [Amphibalanus amphitrite]XP_043210321.1 spermidine synthase-like isoform X2 [Amphibalanus amphitrite]XP_043210398.1 spermidine synthase-like isoform X2 [Amphibalanus amphitrite]